MKIAGIILILLAIGAGVYAFNAWGPYRNDDRLIEMHLRKAEEFKAAGNIQEFEASLSRAKTIGKSFIAWKQKFQISAAVGGGLLIIGLGLLIKGKKS